MLLLAWLVYFLLKEKTNHLQMNDGNSDDDDDDASDDDKIMKKKNLF